MKKNMKKILALLLTASMTLGMTFTASATEAISKIQKNSKTQNQLFRMRVQKNRIVIVELQNRLFRKSLQRIAKRKLQ